MNDDDNFILVLAVVLLVVGLIGIVCINLRLYHECRAHEFSIFYCLLN